MNNIDIEIITISRWQWFWRCIYTGFHLGVLGVLYGPPTRGITADTPAEAEANIRGYE